MTDIRTLENGRLYIDVDGIMYTYNYQGSSTLFNGGGILSERSIVIETERYIFDLSSVLRTTDDRQGLESYSVEKKIWRSKSGRFRHLQPTLSSVRACDTYNDFERVVYDQIRVYTSIGEDE